MDNQTIADKIKEIEKIEKKFNYLIESFKNFGHENLIDINEITIIIDALLHYRQELESSLLSEAK